MLAPWPSFRIVGTALDGYHVLRRVVELDPDLIVVGSQLEGMRGLDLIHQVRAMSPKIRILVVRLDSGSTCATTVDACVQLSQFDHRFPELVQMLFPKAHHRRSDRSGHL